MQVRRVVVFTGVAVVLVAALLFGIFWAKDRSHTIASKSNTDQQQPAAQQPAAQEQKPSTAASNPAPNPPVQSAPQQQSAPKPPATHTVPATGPSNIVFAFLGIVALAFSLGTYIQTRRRLFTIR